MYRKIQSGGGKISPRAVCRAARSGARTKIRRPRTARQFRLSRSGVYGDRLCRSAAPPKNGWSRSRQPHFVREISLPEIFLKKALTQRKICDIIYKLIRRQQVTVKAKAFLPRRRKRTHKSVTLSSGSERELFLSSVTNFSKEEKTNAQSESIGTEGCRS